MATVSYRLRTSGFDQGITRALLAPGGIARRDFQRRALNVKAAARSNLRSRSANSTGKIEGSIHIITGETRTGLQGFIGSDLPEAAWVEEGTGVYGPHRTPIVPRSAPRLAFRIPRTGRLVLARQVRGQPGKHYLRDAIGAVGR